MSLPNIIYFWKPQHKYGFLSNWFNSNIYIDDKTITFINSEQYFMWKKLKFFDPDNIQLEYTLLSSTNSKFIKNCGRKVRYFDQSKWDDIKYSFMKEAVYLKFSQNEKLKLLLLNTKQYMLVEASPFDYIWGIGISMEDSVRGVKWKGQNLLGKILMEVREQLKNEN